MDGWTDKYPLQSMGNYPFWAAAQKEFVSEADGETEKQIEDTEGNTDRQEDMDSS